ncbi:hypothetical protein NUM3379_39340 [Kineococcus sp. NUM-3379]
MRADGGGYAGRERGALGRELDDAAAAERERAAEADPEVLLRRARALAAVRRRRARVLWSAFLVVVVGVPLAVSALRGPDPAQERAGGGTPAPARTTAAPPAGAATPGTPGPWRAPGAPGAGGAPGASGQDSPLLPDAQVAVVLPGLVPVGEPVREPPGAPVEGGICGDDPIPTAGALLGGRRQAWRAPAARGGKPVQELEERVRRFDGDGAHEFLRGVLDLSPNCLTPPERLGEWQFDEARAYRAEEVLAAWSSISQGFDVFATSAVLREGSVVVEVRLVVHGNLNHARDVTRTLAQQALFQALAAEPGW